MAAARVGMNARLGCALAVAALIAAPREAWAQTPPPAVRPVLPALQVVIDPDTGRVRAPDHAEAAAAAAAAAQRPGAAQARRAAAGVAATTAGQRMQQGAPAATARFGARVQRVDPSLMSFSVARRGSDGRIESACVAGESEAAHAAHAKAGAALQRGARDER